MATVLEVVDFYRTTLESLGFILRGNRVVVISQDGEAEEMVDGKVLVVPDDAFLSNPRWSTEIPFHPLCENTQRGESEVVKTVLGSVEANLNTSLMGILNHLYKFALDNPDTTSWSVEQSSMLQYIPNPTKKIRDSVVGMTKLILEEKEEPLIITNLRRRCPLNGEKFERVCVVRFDLAERKPGEKPYGLSTRAQYDTVVGLLDFILPGWAADDSYSAGTNSHVAPYFTATMLAYSKTAEQLNSIIDLFLDKIPGLSMYKLHGAEKVLATLNDQRKMEALRDVLPSFDGSQGSADIRRVSEQPVGGVAQPKVLVRPTTVEQDDAREMSPQSQTQPSSDSVPYVPSSYGLGVNMGMNMNMGMGMNMGMQMPPHQQGQDTFFGRQVSRQMGMMPLSEQVSSSGFIGRSPFSEDFQPQQQQVLAGTPNGEMVVTNPLKLRQYMHEQALANQAATMIPGVRMVPAQQQQQQQQNVNSQGNATMPYRPGQITGRF